MPVKLDAVMRSILGLILAGACAAWAGAVSATPILQVDGTGQLTGALNIVVDGATYNVSFEDGTCVAVFSGCDDASDFAFSTYFPEADQAAGRLSTSVFLDVSSGDFDSIPSLTRGCESLDECTAFIPFELLSNGFPRLAYMSNGPFGDSLGCCNAFEPALDTSDYPNYVWAVFTPAQVSVPEPATLALFGAGLAGLGWFARRRKAA